MKIFKKIVVLFFTLFFIFSSSSHAESKQNITRTFSKRNIVKIKIFNGDCVVEKSGDENIQVQLEHSFTAKVFKPIFMEKKYSLVLKEKIRGSASGKSTWFLKVPDNTFVVFTSASGNLSVKGLKSDVTGETGSGNFEISDFKGKLKLNTGYGNIHIAHTKGSFDIFTAKGDIQADSIEMESSGEFATARGNVSVSLAVSSEYDLTLSSALGDVVLDYKDNAMKGYFEFTARASEADIISAVSFDKEEEFYKDKIRYLRKSLTKGLDLPKILIKVHIGKAVFKANDMH